MAGQIDPGAPWRRARSLAHLGTLTAAWLEGARDDYPGHHGPPDPETAAIVPVLAAACRAGYVTTQSQPGENQPAGGGVAGVGWRQRAAVSGLCDAATLARITSTAEAFGVDVIAHRVARAFARPAAGVVVSQRLRAGAAPEAVTSFGEQPTRTMLRMMWPGLSREARAAVQAAWHVTLVSRAWGPTSDVWRALEAFARVG